MEFSTKNVRIWFLSLFLGLLVGWVSTKTVHYPSSRNAPLYERDLKSLLMNQSFIAGLGNIYCSEILHDAKISPLRKTNTLNNSEILGIIKSTKKILKRSISFGGTTIKNFIVSEEKIGYFKNKLKVYSRDKKKCLRCLKGIVIKKIKQSGRSTFFCERCQK